ncbi:MAG: DUF1838 family protein [Gammaproteobacteria bacterium]|nr:DUF1838 family protein [Gammaproteobacteria bacterium]
MNANLNRRSLLAGALGAPFLAGLAPGAHADEYSGLTDLDLSDDEMLHYFVKLRSSLDDRVTMGWVDAVNYAFVDGVTYPLYRLLSTTIRQMRKVNDSLYKSVSLEVAMYMDIETGELLDKLTMPITGNVVDVPLYRAGPSHMDMTIRADETTEFTMEEETVEGESFFVSGQAESKRFMSLPQRRGDDFYIRQDISARVFPPGQQSPSFFYREWTINQGSWKALADPSVISANVDVAYIANTAFRPWMQMGDTPGHTVQNGRGGKAESPDGLPVELLRLVKLHHPDLIEDPRGVLAGEAA